MSNVLRPDICVIGAGSGGLVVASGAALMGAKVVLIERGLLGGDCLNYGCVPSKAMLAAGEAAVAGAHAAPMGVRYNAPEIDFAAVMDHVHSVIAGIAPTDSEERFRGMGIEVIRDTATFTGPSEVEAGGRRIQARRFVVATGSSPMVPPIPGLADVPYFTNETIFENRERPAHLLVIGGGPIGMEMAQAHRRLGAEVSVIEGQAFLGNEDQELVSFVTNRLQAEGVRLVGGAKVTRVSTDERGVATHVETADGEDTIRGSHLLVATGRAPNVDLGLDAAGVTFDRRGIKTDRRLRTSNKRIYAVGDVAGALQFTHVASYHAGVALRNILFRLPAKVSYDAIPRVTYTDPELAHVGLSEDDARERYGAVSVARWPVAENDRAQAQRDTDGLVKIVSTKRGRIVGVQIVAKHAGELIHPWVLAVARKDKLGAMASYVVPYPTVTEIGKRAVGSTFMAALSSPRTRGLVRFLARFG